MNKYYNFEIYTSDPITNTTGWEIEMLSVKANSMQEAKLKLLEYPNFDVIILFNFSHEENEIHNFLVTTNYPNFKIIKRL
jgi:hypothetical protein